MPSSEPVTINHLNDDVLESVFNHLPPTDRIRIERVCERWQRVSQRAWNKSTSLKLVKEELIVEGARIKDRRGIMSVASRCRLYARRLDLFAYTDKSNELAARIATFFKHLRSVRLSGVSRKVVSIMARKCKELRHVRLRDSLDCCDEALASLFRANRNLRSVELVRVRTKNGARYLCHLSVSTLESFSAFMSNVATEHFLWVFENATRLSKLKFDDYRVDSECIRTLGRVNVNLKELQMGVYMPFAKNLQSICFLRGLRKIDVSCVDVTDGFLYNLNRNCRHLTDVNIANCRSVSDQGVKIVASLPLLERLNLSHLNITNNAFEPMPRLKELECSNCKKLMNKYFINVVNSCDDLELLNVSGCSKVNTALINNLVVKTCGRQNGVVLTVFVGGSRVRFQQIKRASPRLQVILNSRHVESRDYVNLVKM